MKRLWIGIWIDTREHIALPTDDTTEDADVIARALCRVAGMSDAPETIVIVRDHRGPKLCWIHFKSSGFYAPVQSLEIPDHEEKRSNDR